MYNKIPIKGQRAALKSFKQNPQELGIYVDSGGRVYAADLLNATRSDKRVDLRARLTYRVEAKSLTETMIKRVAAYLVNQF